MSVPSSTAKRDHVAGSPADGAQLARRRRSARRAVATALLCMGAGTANWVTRLPSIKADLHLGAGGLGLALAGVPVGYAMAVFATPHVVRRSSSAATARWATAASGLAVVLPALAWDGASLAAFLAVLGLAFGIAEISVNVQAVAVERVYGRPLMSGLHAMWSLGLVVGSLASSVATGAGVSPLGQLLIAALALATVATIAGGRLLPRQLEVSTGEVSGGAPPVRDLPTPTVVLLAGLIAFCSFLTEGSVTDWSGIYMHGSQHAPLDLAALAVTVYSVGQTIARLAGDRIIGRLGRTAALWRTAILAALGMSLALLTTSPQIALVGYGVLGIGVAMIVPTSFSLVGLAAGPAPTGALSRVTAFGYAGAFIGPVLIGLTAHGAGLGVALTIPIAVLLLIVPLTARIRTDLPDHGQQERRAAR